MPRIRLMIELNKIKKIQYFILYFIYGLDKEYSCGRYSSFTDYPHLLLHGILVIWMYYTWIFTE